MAAPSKQPIIIKRKKAGGHGHHGGAWKIAYADMVTAMMAFFLVMWICNMDVKSRIGIADYFSNPTSAPGSSKPSSWFIIQSGGVPRLTQGNLEESQEKGGEPQLEGLIRVNPLDKDNFDADVARIYAKALTTVINQEPAFSELKEFVTVEVTDDGLRVEFSEGPEPRFFSPTTAQWTMRGRMMVTSVASLLGRGNHIASFEGHTTPKPATRAIESKWDLGANRALALRQVFAEAGLSADKVKEVKSLGDTQPRYAPPDDPRNLRIAVFIPFSSKNLKLGPGPGH
jgi:chemotaxis protein MotB